MGSVFPPHPPTHPPMVTRGARSACSFSQTTRSGPSRRRPRGPSRSAPHTRGKGSREGAREPESERGRSERARVISRCVHAVCLRPLLLCYCARPARLLLRPSRHPASRNSCRCRCWGESWGMDGCAACVCAQCVTCAVCVWHGRCLRALLTLALVSRARALC